MFRYPVVHVRDEKDLNLTVNTFLQNWTDKLQLPRPLLYKVYVANLTFAGFNFAKHRDALVALISSKISDDPDRSCAIIIPPNTGPYKTAYDTEAAEQSSRDLFDLLRDPGFDLVVQDCSIFWEASTMWSKSRKLFSAYVHVHLKAAPASQCSGEFRRQWSRGCGWT